MVTHTLFYTPGACSLSPHIALREGGLPFELVKVDLRAKKIEGADWLALNPKGYVPALRLPDGEILTEGAVIVQYIADQVPARNLLPAAGTRERYRANSWLNFIATELHKGVSPFYNALAGDDFRTSVETRVASRLALVAAELESKPYLLGESFSVADGYLFYALHAWTGHLKKSIDAWPVLGAFRERVAARPAVAAAIAAEGIKL